MSGTRRMVPPVECATASTAPAAPWPPCAQPQGRPITLCWTSLRGRRRPCRRGPSGKATGRVALISGSITRKIGAAVYRSPVSATTFVTEMLSRTQDVAFRVLSCRPWRPLSF